MAEFIGHFLFANIIISLFIISVTAVKRLLRPHLSSRIQYNLWFLVLLLLIVPFLPSGLFKEYGLSSWGNPAAADTVTEAVHTADKFAAAVPENSKDWMNDFAVSVRHGLDPSMLGLLSVIWIAGMIFAALFLLRSGIKMNRLKRSALPLQSLKVRRLYEQCLKESGIKRKLPVYSTAFLKSPIMTGIVQPKIYLPIALISDYSSRDLRYMILHELQHYKYKDSFANLIMNTAGIVYWYHPLVWYALKEMRCDRELACDTSVLYILGENECENYGNTLLNFAGKVSLAPFPFVSGLAGSMKQMRRRILNIAGYRTESSAVKIKGIAAYVVIAALLSLSAPILSSSAAEKEYGRFDESGRQVRYTELSSAFGGQNGSFVLYDTKNNSWEIQNRDYADLRVAPNSTYKIYLALLGLEEQVITPEQSFLPWDGEQYPIEAWNSDQDLDSAMKNSVNWYFQNIDQKVGISKAEEYVKNIGYGNEDVSGGTASYWLESSLKISPIEQVELLKKLYENEIGTDSKNINRVKNALRLNSDSRGTLYGKTGTGMVNGQETNGWFIGFIETPDNVCFFAVNLQGKDKANGSSASEIALKILADRGFWNTDSL